MFFYFLNFSMILFIKITIIIIIQKTIIFPVLSRNNAVNQKKNEREYKRDKIFLFESQILANLWCRCVKSHWRGFFFWIILLTHT